MNAVTKYDQMRATLVEVHRIDDVKEIRDKAKALEEYAKQAKDVEAQNYFAEIRVRAERRAGEVLKEMEKAKPSGSNQHEERSRDETDPPKLSDLGISKSQSSLWQSIADIPEEVFEQHVEEAKTKGKELTSTGVQELAKEEKRKRKKQEKEQAKQQVEDLPPTLNWDGQFRHNVIAIADITHIDLPANSIDMIFTDPPYHDEYIDLYGYLAILAAHCLKPGGYLMTYAGKMFLPQIHAALGLHLEYISEFAVFHPFSQSRIMKHNIFENWRPIIAYKKSGRTAVREWVQDVIRGERNKEHHDWQQDEQAPLAYIEAYTKPGDLVLDPFCGGGTTPAACQKIKRHYLAFDRNEDAVRKTIQRLQTSVSQS